MIRKVIPTDIADITAIYNYYIKNTCITFETELVTEEEMSRRMEAIHSDYPYLVMEEGGKLIGYCYAHGWKEKRPMNIPQKLRFTCILLIQIKGMGRSCSLLLLTHAAIRIYTY